MTEDRTIVDQLTANVLALVEAERRASAADLLRALALVEDAGGTLRERFLAILSATDEVERQTHANACITLLQFDDIVGQILRGVAERNETLRAALAALQMRLAEQGGALSPDSLAACRQILAHCEVAIHEAGHAQQESMQRGDVDLF
ncbi:MAG TPA: hypothetical protein VLA56_14265 [Pseudomonadales bacterium]|nr:hypothetical protein [Pseudomonadales bacterium]